MYRSLLTLCLCTILAAGMASQSYAEEKSPTIIKNDLHKGSKGETEEEVLLTEESIKNYMNAAKRIHLRPYNEYLSFIKIHTSDDAQITIDSTTNLPNNTKQKQTIVLDKSKFIQGLPENYQMTEGARITHQILSMSIASDGKSAKLRDVTTMSNVVELDAANRKVRLSIEAQSDCSDELIRGPGGIPQLQKSNCTAETYISPKAQ